MIGYGGDSQIVSRFPYMRVNLFSGENHSRAASQQMQQVKLLRCQVDCLPPYPHFPAQRINKQFFMFNTRKKTSGTYTPQSAFSAHYGIENCKDLALINRQLNTYIRTLIKHICPVCTVGK